MAVLKPEPGSIFDVGLYGGIGVAHTVANTLNHAPDMVWVKSGRDGFSITEAMLQADVFSVPVDSLIDIWTLRFGSTWVNLEDIETDEFFKMAYVRLKSLGKLEVHYLTDRSRYVCRKPE